MMFSMTILSGYCTVGSLGIGGLQALLSVRNQLVNKLNLLPDFRINGSFSYVFNFLALFLYKMK